MVISYSSSKPQTEITQGTGITVGDLRRAILRGGDVSSMESVLQRALGCPPFPVISSFKEPQFITDSAVLFSSAGASLSDFSEEEIKNVETSASLFGIDIKLVPIAPYGRNIARFLTGLFKETKPDIIAMDLSPVEMGAQILYTFSFFNVLGLPLQADIRFADSGEEYLNKLFYPGSVPSTAILRGFLDKTPLIPVGRPLRSKRQGTTPDGGVIDLDLLENPQWESNLLLAYREINEVMKGVDNLEEYIRQVGEISLSLTKTLGGTLRDSLIEEARYSCSRILDFTAGLRPGEHQARLLVLVDPSRYGDIEYIIGLLRQGISEEIYKRAESNRRSRKMVLAGWINEAINDEAQDYLPEKTPAQELFLSALEQYNRSQESEILSESEFHRLIVQISRRTRIHPDIIRGVSVRGAIAFEEVARGVSELHQGITRVSLAKAAMITIPPRINVKPEIDASSIVKDITLEALYGLSFSGDAEEALSGTLKKASLGDILSNLNPLAKTPSEQEHQLSQGKLPVVISETDKNRETLKRLEEMRFLKKDEQGRYQLTRKALEQMLMDLEQRLKAGEITPDEYNRQKSTLMKAMRQITKPQYRISSRELATTVMEMMDAQDKLWEKDINFNTMHVYYHIKENSEGAALIPQKREYQALKRLIDDLDRRKILAASEKSSGFVLTGMALNMLLKYLMDKDMPGSVLQGVMGQGRTLTSERKNEVRRYSAGDAFRDISFRQTLKEIVRQKRNLKEVRNSDFRVFMKRLRQPKADIIICLDTSGSMGFHQKLTYARLAAAGIAQAALEEGNRVGLVAFNDYGQATVPLTADDKEGLLNCIAATTPRGNTNIGDGIKSSVDLLFKSFNNNQKYIMLITDGQPTAISESDFDRLKGDRSRDLTEESALLEARRAVTRGVRVSVVYIAAESEASGEFIKEIARVGKGKIRRVSNSDDLKVAMK